LLSRNDAYTFYIQVEPVRATILIP
jgi:hypothetical protein